MEPKLRKLGLPVKLVRGVVTLTKDYTICKEGDILDPSQAKLLVWCREGGWGDGATSLSHSSSSTSKEYFEITMVQFHIILMTHFHDGKLTELVSKEAIAEAIKPGPKRNAEQRDAGDDEEEDENAEDAAMEQDGDDDEANDFDE